MQRVLSDHKYIFFHQSFSLLWFANLFEQVNQSFGSLQFKIEVDWDYGAQKTLLELYQIHLMLFFCCNSINVGRLNCSHDRGDNSQFMHQLYIWGQREISLGLVVIENRSDVALGLPEDLSAGGLFCFWEFGVLEDKVKIVSFGLEQQNLVIQCLWKKTHLLSWFVQQHNEVLKIDPAYWSNQELNRHSSQFRTYLLNHPFGDGRRQIKIVFHLFFSTNLNKLLF